jgi:hypothetical protein
MGHEFHHTGKGTKWGQWGHLLSFKKRPHKRIKRLTGSWNEYLYAKLPSLCKGANRIWIQVYSKPDIDQTNRTRTINTGLNYATQKEKN